MTTPFPILVAAEAAELIPHGATIGFSGFTPAGSAKVIDFNDGRGMRIRHIARFCEAVGVESAHFIGNSMGAVNMMAVEEYQEADHVLYAADRA